jgi:NADH:ubiquinone oxidoreductase subunit 2 (subunit N)
MPIVTIVAGGLLTLLGIFGYLASESQSLTALIPLAIGLPLETCGALAMRPAFRKHAMHGASVLALLGVLGSAPGAVRYLRVVTSSAEPARPLALQMQTAMFVICLLLLVLCIRSFTSARARRAVDAGVR